MKMNEKATNRERAQMEVKCPYGDEPCPIIEQCKEVRRGRKTPFSHVRYGCKIFNLCKSAKDKNDGDILGLHSFIEETNNGWGIYPGNGSGATFWCTWIEIRTETSHRYGITFRCDNYPQYDKWENEGKNLEVIPFFNNPQPHDFESFGKIQFVELRHIDKVDKNSAYAVYVESNGKRCFPNETSNRHNYSNNPRPGKVWPLTPGENISDDDAKEKLASLLGKDGKDLLEALEREKGWNFHVNNSDKIKKMIAELFYKWVMALEQANT